MDKKLVILFLVASLFSFAYLTISQNPSDSNVTYPRDQIERDLALIKNIYYNFNISTFPGEVDVKAGENATVNVTIVNTGQFALRDFNLTLEGADFPYEITPLVKEIPVWGEWNSKDGLLHGKQTYQISINVPANATGVQLVNITGKENFSWRKFSKKTIFILKIIPSASVEQNITVSKIEIPETLKENVPFNINFSVINKNAFRQQIDLLLKIPSDWAAVGNNRSLLLDTNEAANVSFKIVPTNSSGNISIDIVYPVKKTIFSFTREGSSLIPVTEKPKEETPVNKTTGLSRVIGFLRNLSPIFLAILVLIAIIVVWFIVTIVRFYTTRKKPESMSRQTVLV